MSMDPEVMTRPPDKGDVHSLEPDGLAALTLEASAIDQSPLAEMGKVFEGVRGRQAQLDQALGAHSALRRPYLPHVFSTFRILLIGVSIRRSDAPLLVESVLWCRIQPEVDD